jgi:hypothetical protein
MFGAWHLLEAAVAPRALVSAEAVPYRPNRGVHLRELPPRHDASLPG